MLEPITFITSTNCDFVKRGQLNKELILRICFRVSEDFAKTYPTIPSDMILVVDTSGSMDERAGGANTKLTKREAVFQAASQLPNIMAPCDTLSLISFNSSAFIEFKRLHSNDREELTKGFEKILKREGGTNFEEAFKMIKRTIKELNSGSTRVIFLTDGKPTEGDLEKAHTINTEFAQQGVVVDCLGVGKDFNFGEMKKFTNVSHGTTDILDQPEQAFMKFQEFLKESQQSTIRRVNLRLIFDKNCKDLEMGQLSPEIRYFGNILLSPAGDYFITQTLPAIHYGVNYTFLVRFKTDIPADIKISRYEFCEVQLSYFIPAENKDDKLPSIPVGIHLSDDNTTEEHDTQIDSEFDEIILVKLSEEINQAMKAKKWNDVSKFLAQKLEIAKQRRLPDEEKQCRQLIEDLKNNGSLTEDQINRMYRASSTTRTKAKYYKTEEDDLI